MKYKVPVSVEQSVDWMAAVAAVVAGTKWESAAELAEYLRQTAREVTRGKGGAAAVELHGVLWNLQGSVTRQANSSEREKWAVVHVMEGGEREGVVANLTYAKAVELLTDAGGVLPFVEEIVIRRM